MKPLTGLLESLTTSRFLVSEAKPTVGLGERRSSTLGAGMEFASYRPYQAGDDIRHLDMHVYARLGENVIRQYTVDRQLPITIIVDASTSMTFGEPSKIDVARQLAHLLGYVGLAAGDRVQVGLFADRGLVWSPRMQGREKAEVLFAWLEDSKAEGGQTFDRAIYAAIPDLKAKGLVILISDWWTEELTRELKALQSTGQEVLAIHVMAPEEIDPELLGPGLVDMVDSESGEEIELMLDAEMLASYRAALSDWRQALRDEFATRGWRYFPVSTASSLEHFLLRELRGAGVIS